MNHIELYLEKFKSLGATDFSFKKKICDIVNSVSKIDLQEEEVELFNGRVVIRISGVRKTEFVLYKDTIVKEINSKMDIS
jgi:hypothetical protein